MINVEKNVLEYLDERGIKKSHVLKKTGIQRSRFYNVLKGKGKFTSTEIALICNATGADPRDILSIKEAN